MTPTTLRRPALAAALCALTALPARADGPRRIEDNSFLLEEAYNQEPGVIQHISLFTRARKTGSWSYTFTEEWPAHGEAHQVSATVQVLHDAPQRETGFGDVLLNYRWQALGSDDSAVAVAPRASAILPTGAWRSGFGMGGPGLQVNLPISTLLGRSFVAHANVGGTWIPAARSPAGDGPSYSVNLGQSVIWLLHPNVNLMLEAAYLTTEIQAPGGTLRTDSLQLSPGIRGALNFASGLQIVGGVALPFGVGPSAGSHAILGYLSFEHPVTKHPW